MNETDTEVPAEIQPSSAYAPAEPKVSPLGPADHEPGPAILEIKESLNPGQQRTVPYGALAEERARRKELQRELQNAIESQQRLQGRLDLLHELAQQQGAAEAGAAGELAPEREESPSHDDPPDESPISDVDAQAGAHFR